MNRFSFSPFAFSVALHAGAAALFLTAARNLPVSPFYQSKGPIEVSLLESETPKKLGITPETRILSPDLDVKNGNVDSDTSFTVQSSGRGHRHVVRSERELQRGNNLQYFARQPRSSRREFSAPTVRQNILRSSAAPQRSRVADSSPFIAPSVNSSQKTAPQKSMSAPHSTSQAKVLNSGVAPAPQSLRDEHFDVPVGQPLASSSRSNGLRDGGVSDFQPRSFPSGNSSGTSFSGGFSSGSGSNAAGFSNGSSHSDGSSNGRGDSSRTANGGNSGGSFGNESAKGNDRDGSGDASTRNVKPTETTRRAEPEKPKPQIHNSDEGISKGHKKGRGRGSRVEIDDAKADPEILRRVRRPAKIKARIKAKGDVDFTIEESSGDRDFDEKSLEIVRKGRYKPKTNDKGEAEDSERIIKVKPQDEADE